MTGLRKWRSTLKKTRAYRIWQIIYPVGIYYVVSSLTYFALEMLLGTDNQSYMMRQLICAAATIPFIMTYYMQDKKLENHVYGERKLTLDGKLVRDIFLVIGSAMTLGIAVNNIIAMTPLVEKFTGFTEANEAFFAGQVIYELLGSCLLIPIAEELLYRGVVYKRLRLLVGVTPAIVLSALLFGLMHVNLVQFLYAGILGLLLAFMLERTGRLYAPILGHIAANLAAVIRQETGWLNFSYEPTVAGIGFTVLMLLIAVALIWYQILLYKRENLED